MVFNEVISGVRVRSSSSPKDVGYQSAVDGIFLLWLGARARPYSNHSNQAKIVIAGEGGKGATHA